MAGDEFDSLKNRLYDGNVTEMGEADRDRQRNAKRVDEL
jgi:hypothetical protein